MTRAQVLLLFVAILQLTSFCLSAPNKYKIPDYLTLCRRSDPKLNSCLQQAFKDLVPHLKEGIPAFGVPSLDPMALESIELDVGTFKAEYKDIKIYNTTKVQLLESSIDYSKMSGFLKLHFTELFIDGHFDIGGQLLLLQLNGKGYGSCTLSDLTAWIDWKANRITKNGHPYLVLSDESVIDGKIGQIHLDFGDVLRDNPQLEQITNQILNENLEEITNEIKPAVREIIKNLVFGIVNKIFASYTEDELFPKD